MSDKSFEQQVREELSNLRIKPDAAVWEVVAASLQKKRKRRWAIWLFSLLAGLSGAGFWLFLSPQNTTIVSRKSTHQKTEQNIQEQFIQPNQKSSTITANQIADPLVSDNNGSNASVEKKKSQTAEVIYLSKKEPKRSETITEQIDQEKNKKDNEDLKKSLTNNDTEETIQASTIIPVKKDSSVAIIQGEVIGNTDIAIIEKQTVNDPIITVTDTVKIVVPKNKERTWNWRGNLHLGQSGVRNSVGSLFGSSNADAYGNLVGNVLPSSPTTGFNLVRPKVQDYFSFGADIELSRTIGNKKKNSISFQAGYHLYQTKTRVGRTNSGTLQFSNVNRSNESNIYYGVNDSATYISSYHFIRLGVQLYRSLNRLNKAPIRWYAGAGGNLMVSGNGLHLGYANSNIYFFKNRSLLRNIQLDLTTGLEFGLGKQQRFFIGPQVQYMLSNLSRQSGVNQHLFRPSVKLSVPLSKNR